MKTLRCRWAIRLMVVQAALVTCTVGKTDTGTDIPGGGTPTDGTVISIAALKAMYVNRPVAITDEVCIEGQVVSSDLSGNFYKTLFVQDATGGIAVRLDLEDYYQRLPYGSRVRIYCNSLALGSYGGAVQLGVLSGNGVERIPAEYVFSAITVTGAATEAEYEVVTIPEIGPAHIGRLVVVEDVQFVDGGVSVPWVEDGSDTSRPVTDRAGNTIDVRTSSHASFGTALLPSGSGYIKAVAGYFNGTYQLTVSFRSDVWMNGERFEVL